VKKVEEARMAADEARYAAFYEPIKAIYDELIVKYGGDIDKVRENMPNENYVIGYLPQHIQMALGTKAGTLWFSSDSLAKQLNHHPELTPTAYANVFSRLKDCKEIYTRGNLKVALVVENERPYVVILKTTNDNAETYMVALYEPQRRYLANLREGKNLY